MTIHFHRIDQNHWWCESSTKTLVTYDLTLNEHDEFQCSCEGYFYRHDCRHLRELLDFLSIRPRVYAVRPSVKQSGLTLADLYEYAAPAPVTNRERVKQHPSY